MTDLPTPAVPSDDTSSQQPQDGATPFSEPTDAATNQPAADPTNPVTDSASDIDSTQAYNEGVAGAAEAGTDPAATATTNTVVDFTPPPAQEDENEDETVVDAPSSDTPDEEPVDQPTDPQPQA